MDGVKFIIDRNSFPIHCNELDDFYTIMAHITEKVVDIKTDNPTSFFRQCLDECEDGVLVIPVTRNIYVRDRLRQEGVNLVVCL